VAGLEWVDREGADVMQPAPGIGIERAVPGEIGLLRLVRIAVAQRIELQLQPRPEYRLGVGEDRGGRPDAAGERKRGKRREREARGFGAHSAASCSWPSRLLSVLSRLPAASAITVPGGKIASAPAFLSAS